MRYIVEGEYAIPELFSIEVDGISREDAEDVAFKTIQMQVPESQDIVITRAENIDG